MKPRNSLVTIAPLPQKEQRHGDIVIPSESSREYQQAEVISVGPGVEHDDLQPGQLVLVKLKRRGENSMGGLAFHSMGIECKTSDGRDIVIVEEMSIVGIVYEPDEWQASDYIDFDELGTDSRDSGIIV